MLNAKFCHACKTRENLLEPAVANYSVWSCAKGKEYESGIQCPDLESCTKELWSRFPDFKKMVIEM